MQKGRGVGLRRGGRDRHTLSEVRDPAQRFPLARNPERRLFARLRLYGVFAW